MFTSTERIFNELWGPPVLIILIQYLFFLKKNFFVVFKVEEYLSKLVFGVRETSDAREVIRSAHPVWQ